MVGPSMRNTEDMIAVLFPRFDHPAIEERYASWQSQMLLRDGGDVDLVLYDPAEPASYAVQTVDDEFVLVITDPLLVPPARLAHRLRDVLESAPDAAAALPVSNEASNPSQKSAPDTPYLTLRELQEVTAGMQARRPELIRATWDKSDPAAYLCRTAILEQCDDVLRRALTGRQVVISRNDYAHRWIPMRAEMRADLLPLIPTDAKSIIELGCGEGSLGAALKPRQRCRGRAESRRRRARPSRCARPRHRCSSRGRQTPVAEPGAPTAFREDRDPDQTSGSRRTSPGCQDVSPASR